MRFQCSLYCQNQNYMKYWILRQGYVDSQEKVDSDLVDEMLPIKSHHVWASVGTTNTFVH